MKYKVLISLTASAILLGGCFGNYQDEYIDNNATAAMYQSLTLELAGMLDSFIEIESDGQTYKLYEDGLFETNRDTYQYETTIVTQPIDANCFLFDRNGHFYEKASFCTDKAFPIVNTIIPLDSGWSYGISGSTTAMYSQEQATVTDVNATKELVLTGTAVGQFFGDGAELNTMQYVGVGDFIGGDPDRNTLQQVVYETFINSGIVLSMSETYQHDIGYLTTIEYTADLSKNLKSAELITELAKGLRSKLVEQGGYASHEDIVYSPTPTKVSLSTSSYRIAISVWPSTTNALYMFSAAPESMMADGAHFPTPDLHKE